MCRSVNYHSKVILSSGREPEILKGANRAGEPLTIQAVTWTLGKDVTAELNIKGKETKPSHLEALRQYVELHDKLALAEGA